MVSLTQMLSNAQFNVKFEDSITENRVSLEVLYIHNQFKNVVIAIVQE